MTKYAPMATSLATHRLDLNLELPASAGRNGLHLATNMHERRRLAPQPSVTLRDLAKS